jgi:GntR family carbon starvation induced transcriptional regulator
MLEEPIDTKAAANALDKAGSLSETFASLAYNQLRRDIVAGRFDPGAKLHIQKLCERYEVGLNPMREALNRLSREGLVTQSDRRGFRVISLDFDHLEALNKTRCWLNEIGLRESILHGGEGWEEAVLLSERRLARLPRHLGDGDEIVSNPAWEDAHRQFHASLLSACGSPWVITYCDQLFDAAEWYRNISRISVSRRERRVSEHKDIAKAALARDVSKATALLTQHFVRTAELVRERLSGKVPGSPTVD